MATEILGITAGKLRKGFVVAEDVTCTNADTDYAMASAVEHWARYLVVYCASACKVAMGEATSATVGVYVAAGVPTMLPIVPTGTTADDKAHVQSAAAGAVVTFTQLMD